MKRFLTVIALSIASFATHAQSFSDGRTPYIVTFWFNTCKYCIQEMDAIAEKLPEWRKDGPVRVYAVCIDSQRSVSKSKVMVSAHDWEEFEMVWDVNGDLKRKYNVVSCPHLLLFDKDGKLFYSHVGYAPGDEDLLRDALKECR